MFPNTPFLIGVTPNAGMNLYECSSGMFRIYGLSQGADKRILSISPCRMKALISSVSNVHKYRRLAMRLPEQLFSGQQGTLTMPPSRTLCESDTRLSPVPNVCSIWFVLWSEPKKLLNAPSFSSSTTVKTRCSRYCILYSKSKQHHVVAVGLCDGEVLDKLLRPEVRNLFAH